MSNYKEIYETMEMGYELILTASSNVSASRVHNAVRGRIYNLFSSSLEEKAFFAEAISKSLDNDDNFSKITDNDNSYLKSIGALDNSFNNIKTLFILFASDEVREDEKLLSILGINNNSNSILVKTK